MKHLRRIALILLCLLLTACTQEAEQVEYYCTRRIQTVGESISQTDTTYTDSTAAEQCPLNAQENKPLLQTELFLRI